MDGVVQLDKTVFRMARTHAHTEAPFVAVTKEKLEVRSIRSRYKEHIYL